MKRAVFLTIIFTLFLYSTAYAIPLRLTLQSYSPATLPIVSTIIDVLDINDQLEISRQAALLALSSDGWGLEMLGGILSDTVKPPKWTGSTFRVGDVKGESIDERQLIDELFGYELDQIAIDGGGGRGLTFHTDEWCERLLHDIGESIDNFGVITGQMGGAAWSRAPVPNWGRFSVEQVEPIPEPATILLLGSGLIGLAGARRKFKK